MSFTEIRNLAMGVISSWQVITATVGVVLYLLLIFYVSDLKRRPRSPSVDSRSKASSRKARKAAAESVPETSSGGGSGMDELGIEEE
jgi:hypothetical protein